MPIRSLRRTLREIDRNSRQVKRGWADRALGAAFVAGLFLSPLIVFKMESWVVKRSTDTLALVAVFKSLEGEDMGGIRIRDPKAKGPMYPGSTVPLAEAKQLQDRARHGWPLVTKDVTMPPRFELKLLPACPESRQDAVIAAAQAALDADAQATRPGVVGERVHVGGWIFSVGAWWLLLTFAGWVLLLPVRVGREMHRVARNAVRQGRIDRCHCPNCGYNARESIQTGRCPECGCDLYERPDW
ncbi:MAG: hypothetical protein RLY21_1087 [Planctomycetota bacterium]